VKKKESISIPHTQTNPKKLTGIYTILYNESTASNELPFTGTPTTGNGVNPATIPGKRAAPPAPAIIILNPLVAAHCAYSTILSGGL